MDMVQLENKLIVGLLPGCWKSLWSRTNGRVQLGLTERGELGFMYGVQYIQTLI